MMPQLTHRVQLAEMELWRRCMTIENFCATASLIFESTLSTLRERLREAEQQAIKEFGEVPQDPAEMHGGDVAFEVASVEDAYDLVGPFSLQYVTSTLEKFLEDVTESCGWQVAKTAGSNYEKLKKAIEDGGEFKFDDGPVKSIKVEELFLARNDFVHNRGIVRECYTGRISTPRFVKDGKIVVRVSQVAEVTEELRTFAGFVVSVCRPFSKPFP